MYDNDIPEDELFYRRKEIKDAYHPVAKLIGLLCLELGITEEKFLYYYSVYAKNNNIPLFTSDKFNKIKAIKSPSPSFRTLFILAEEILDHDLLSMSLKVKNKKTGKTLTINSDDIIKEKKREGA